MRPNQIKAEEVNANSKNIQELKMVAIHEAAHAVIDYLMKFRIKKVTIIPNEQHNYLGYAETYPTFHKKLDPKTLTVKYQVENYLYWTDNKIFKYIKTCLAGYIAGNIMEGKEEEEIEIDLSSPDYKIAIDLASDRCGNQEEVNALLTYLWWNVYNTLILDYNWFLVEALANELLEKKEMSGRQVKLLLKEKEKEYRMSKRKGS